jgi:hypothetical protein
MLEACFLCSVLMLLCGLRAEHAQNTCIARATSAIQLLIADGEASVNGL